MLSRQLSQARSCGKRGAIKLAIAVAMTQPLIDCSDFTVAQKRYAKRGSRSDFEMV